MSAWRLLRPAYRALKEVPPLSALNRFMTRGFVPPQVHGVLDYPLAAVLIAGPLVLDFDYTAATVIALVLGGAAAVLAVGTNWTTGIVKVIPPLLHGYVDVLATIALIVLPFAVGFSYRTNALLFYVIVGGLGLIATLATRFESTQRMAAESPMMVPKAA
jgi:hypothetical protein